MKAPPEPKKTHSSDIGSAPRRSGFVLVAALTLLALMFALALILLGVLHVERQTTRQMQHQAQARQNALSGLRIALGHLQEEMGPDMRVSSESALLDRDPLTGKMDSVAQSRWLAAYEAWGDWLNNRYTLPEGGPTLDIQDTYDYGRHKTFRRWLLSLPPELQTDISAPLDLSAWDDANSVVLVGAGSLGASAQSDPDKVTRAYLTPINERENLAWWIGPENHKARIDLARRPRSLSLDQWETSQGDTAEAGVGALAGLEAIDSDPELSAKLDSLRALQLAQVTGEVVQEHFFDLTAVSEGVLASVRTGCLKKDLSLLFEQDNADLPNDYRFNSSDDREPSIRPMSADLLAKKPKITERHFASWTNMRHFYRMYRNTSDANTGSIGSSGALKWSGSKPWSEVQAPLLYRDKSNQNQWLGNNSYHRLPILAKLTFIYSLMSEKAGGSGSSSDPFRYRLFLVYTPVFTYWNPYNVELRIPDNILGCLSSTYQVLPMGTQFYLGDAAQNQPSSLFTSNAHSFLRSGNSGDIVFKPGEFRLFSHASIGAQGNQYAPESLMPGFDPMAYGGDLLRIGSNNGYTEAQRPGLLVQFSYSEWGGNVSYGNTPGSLCHTPFWLADSQRDRAFNWNIPVMYQNDWFNLAQTYTPLTPPGTANIARWVFADSEPVPVAYAQLVLKGLSEFDYESISWSKDWRCRNWLHSPPFYFGGGLHISENATIAHTQRLDCPYVMNFGPMSNTELPKVVFHMGEKALGSGASPFEKVTAVPALELPSAPAGSLAGFSGMRINPGWADPRRMNPDLSIESRGGHNTWNASYYFAVNKSLSYQSGVTGPGIGNSFMHPMLPRTDIYQYFNNSVSADPAIRYLPLENINFNDNKVFCDFWDHAFLLNDALWDDYFLSSLADQTRPGANSAASLTENLARLVANQSLSNSRYRYHPGGLTDSEVQTALKAADGYLKAAQHLMVEGMFNVNSTSIDAWHALFAGIRERKAVYRDKDGKLQEIPIPSGKRIAISRLNTEVSDQEMEDVEFGVRMPDGSQGWSGVRFLDDAQLHKLAEECVKQVKRRGPFLNFSEFINRRLSNDDLGLMGALQSAIDYDDANPSPESINFRYKASSDFMMNQSDLGNHDFTTPEAVEGSRFAGIPGYVIQSDLLKPIANTLAVRDDTFRIRTYGDVRTPDGRTAARAWCEAIVQRTPEYCDPSDEPHEPARKIDANGRFIDSGQLVPINEKLGRKFRIVSFRWLNAEEV